MNTITYVDLSELDDVEESSVALPRPGIACVGAACGVGCVGAGCGAGCVGAGGGFGCAGALCGGVC